MPEFVLCTYENRPDNFIGLKLLCLSINRQNPGLALFIYSNHFPSSLRNWVQRETRDVTLVEFHSERRMTWDVKPQVLLHMLAQGHSKVMWIDTDIIVTNNISPLLDAVPSGAIGVAEEIGAFDPRRVTVLGLEVGRELSKKLNSSLIYIEQAHKQLLERWMAIMEGESFQSHQVLPGEERHDYFWSDQDVLMGLLCATAPNGFSDVPVKFFDVDAVITHGDAAYRLKARLKRCLRPLVPFVHTNGMKPWHFSDKQTKQLSMELSLYSYAAMPYSNALTYEERQWINPRSKTARLCNLLMLGNPHLRGALPMFLNEIRRST